MSGEESEIPREVGQVRLKKTEGLGNSVESPEEKIVKTRKTY